MFYGDMKAANLLIYRDMRVKLGDFGISVKLSPSDIGADLEKYLIKGMTPGYVTEKIRDSFKSSSKVSKNDMFLCD